MTRLLCFAGFLALAACGASADEYRVAYEGDDFPENEGWQRVTFGGGAARHIQNGSLVIDSRASVEIADFYERHPGHDVDPAPGELFVLQWRLRIDAVMGFRDPGVAVVSDDRWAVGFTFDEDTIRSSFEPGVTFDFEPGVFHEFELRSPDMRSYSLRMDDALVLEGSFWESLSEPGVGWGDVVLGGASLVRWDYVRFGVVPEPRPGLLIALGFLVRRDRT